MTAPPPVASSAPPATPRPAPRAAPRAALALRLAARELRGGLGGFRIFLACLTLGVAAVATVGSVSEAMLDGLRAEGRVLLGGDLEVRLSQRPATEEQRAWMAARAEVSEVVEMRTMVRSEDPGSPRRLIEFRAVDGAFPHYGDFELEPAADLYGALDLHGALARRAGVWGAAIHPALLARLGVALGARLRVGEAVYEARAILTREPDHTGRDFSLGPSFMVALESLGETGLVQPGSLISYRYRLRLPEGVDAAALRRDLGAAFPEAGWRLRDFREAAPGARHFIERLGLYLAFIGLTSLLVGGLGIANGVGSYLRGKVATIATLECLGAPPRLVFQVYMFQVAALAAAGILLGLALGAGAAQLAVWLLGDRFGWRAAGGLAFEPLAAAALMGGLVAATFSLPALARAGRTPPAALFRVPVAAMAGGMGWRAGAGVALLGLALALATLLVSSDRWLAMWFVVGAAASFLVFRAAAWGLIALARRLPRPRAPGLRLALANLHRPGAPTASVVLAIGLGLTVMVAIAQIEANLASQVRRSLPEAAPAFYFLDIQTDQVADFEAAVRAVPGVSELRRVPMLRGRITAVRGVPPEELELSHEIAWVFRGDRGLTWTREPPPGAEITAGDWWPADYDGPPLVSLDSEVGEALGLAPGDELTVNLLGRDIDVEIANLRVIEWSNLAINFVLVFSPGLLERAPQTHLATVKVRPDAEDAVDRAVGDGFANVTAVRVREALAAAARLIGHIATAVSLAALVGLAVGVLVLGGAVAASHQRRVYDAVVLKVLGARRATIARAFLYEYGILGLTAAILAGAIGSLAAYLVTTELLEMSFVFRPGAVAAGALPGVAIALVFGFAGTWRALSQPAAPLLRNE